MIASLRTRGGDGQDYQYLQQQGWRRQNHLYVYNVAHVLSRRELTVLMVDCDSQCNLTSYAMEDADIKPAWRDDGNSIYQVIDPVTGSPEIFSVIGLNARSARRDALNMSVRQRMALTLITDRSASHAADRLSPKTATRTALSGRTPSSFASRRWVPRPQRRGR